ncbi:hypothetical protein DL93DRAFT_1726052 [Clavulina sp. PMI_390]|nr:hypothetical protein DL93DRAFT_1726052 [Clavulina sp. PMI_390]
MLDEDGEGVDNPLETRVIAQTEKGVKVRWPPKRTTIGEMRRRVRSMMEYVARAQLDAGERERRVELLKTAMAVQAQAAAAAAAMGSHEPMMAVDASVLVGDGPLKPTADEHATVPAMTNSDSSTLVDVGSAPLENAAKEVADEEMEIAAADNGQPLPSSVPSSSDTPGPPLSADEVIKAALHPDAGVNGTSSSSSSLRAKDENGPSSSLTTPPSISTPRQFSSLNANLPTTTQLLDELTRELIQFQEQFGAGREGKVYVTGRVEARERRTRAAAPTGPLNSAGPEIDI